ncbi:hypothetical protein AB0J83_27225 [Actinoplanes sp. NPDC049596]|uniref:hypothetical protein n=1 Tax=unclassified Actinoplanes TaxID=2626549 RepID=UPI00341A4F88
MYAAFGFTGLCLLVLCFALVMVSRAEIMLDLRHHIAEGPVVETSTSVRGPGSAEVAFTAGDLQRTAWVEQPWWGTPASVGDRLRIEYSPTHPSVARRVGAHDAVSLAGVIASASLTGLAFEALRRRAGRRPRRRRA